MNIRVLLVEDNAVEARLVREYLSEAGAGQYDVTHAERLEESLRHINDAVFDVILLDLGLPDGHGLDALDYVAKACDTPVVILTGSYDDELAVRAIRKGAQEYLTKDDISRRVLERTIRHAIERHRASNLGNQPPEKRSV